MEHGQELTDRRGAFAKVRLRHLRECTTRTQEDTISIGSTSGEGGRNETPARSPTYRRIGLALTLAVTTATTVAASMPSEEHIFRQGTVEPALDEMTGNLTYILTPDAPMNANPAAWAPLYIPVYPLSAAASLGTHNCMHVPGDNCPDRGPGVAAGAAALQVLEFGHRLGCRHRFLMDQSLATKAVPRL